MKKYIAVGLVLIVLLVAGARPPQDQEKKTLEERVAKLEHDNMYMGLTLGLQNEILDEMVKRMIALENKNKACLDPNSPVRPSSRRTL